MLMKETLNTNAQAVLDTVRAVNTHPTALEVYEMVKQNRPRIGLASIYRILGHLVEQGYIKEMKQGDDSSRYDGRTARHDHAICSDCGALLDLPIDVMVSQSVLQQAAQAVGMELDTHEVRIYGHCSSCQARQAQQNAHI
jgi:Fur family transcriptional regulator, peroxide stress response regulator